MGTLASEGNCVVPLRDSPIENCSDLGFRSTDFCETVYNYTKFYNSAIIANLRLSVDTVIQSLMEETDWLYKEE